MGLAPSGQHENTANLLYAEVPVPIYSHRRWAGNLRRRRMVDFVREWLAFGPATHTYVQTTDSRLRGSDGAPNSGFDRALALPD
jgi:hypothetical protein